jgi:hypothetical protein
MIHVSTINLSEVNTLSSIEAVASTVSLSFIGPTPLGVPVRNRSP